MPYVQRNQAGAICGLYAFPQPGYAEEALSDDNAEVVAYRNPGPTVVDVDAERDRRIAETFHFSGKPFQLDAASQLNVTAMGSLARFAVLAGAAAGNLRWADPAVDFGWIASDNTIVAMDAPTMSSFSDHVRSWVSAHIFAARGLKDTSPIPADYAADSRWPIS